MNKPTRIVTWIAQIIAGVILLQTLFFKFTGSVESVALFQQLGAEPYGRLLTGVLELVASAFLLIPRTVAYGAFLAFGLMCGALLSHLTVLGFQGGMSTLGLLAVLVWLCSGMLLLLHRHQLPLAGLRRKPV